MTVSTICTHNVATVRSDTDAATIAREMRNTHVGDVVVTERRGTHVVPIGLVTDRDIVVELVAKSVDPATVTAADMISGKVITVRDDNSITHALAEMNKGGVRRAPVVDSHGALIGLLSMDDIIEHLATQVGHIAGSIQHERRNEATSRPVTVPDN